MHLSGRDLLGVLFICISYSDGLVLKSKSLSVTLEDDDSIEVIYIDHNHFHMVGNVDGGPNTNYHQ